MALLILLVAWAGCDRDEESTPRVSPPSVNLANAFSVDLRGGFTGAKVIVFADDDAVYQGTPTTNPVLGFADSFAATAKANPCPSQKPRPRGTKAA